MGWEKKLAKGSAKITAAAAKGFAKNTTLKADEYPNLTTQWAHQTQTVLRDYKERRIVNCQGCGKPLFSYTGKKALEKADRLFEKTGTVTHKKPECHKMAIQKLNDNGDLDWDF